MSDVAADVAAAAAFLAADTKDVFSAAKAAEGRSCLAIKPLFQSSTHVPWAHGPLA